MYLTARKATSGNKSSREQRENTEARAAAKDSQSSLNTTRPGRKDDRQRLLLLIVAESGDTDAATAAVSGVATSAADADDSCPLVVVDAALAAFVDSLSRAAATTRRGTASSCKGGEQPRTPASSATLRLCKEKQRIKEFPLPASAMCRPTSCRKESSWGAAFAGTVLEDSAASVFSMG